MYYNGKVIDSETMAGIPSATVRFMAGSTPIGATIANQYGDFSINTNSNADKVIISSVGYLTATFPIYGNYQHTFELERKPISLEEVIIPAHPKKKPFPYWIFIIPLLLIKRKK